MTLQERLRDPGWLTKHGWVVSAFTVGWRLYAAGWRALRRLPVVGQSLHRWVGRDLVIKEASAADLHELGAKLNPSDPDEAITARPGDIILVARKKCGAVGYGQVIHAPAKNYPGYWVFGLAVLNRYRGQGIAEAMCRAGLTRLRQAGVRECLGLVSEDNLAALRLYEKLGCTRCDLPALEAQLEARHRATGHRHVVLRMVL